MANVTVTDAMCCDNAAMMFYEDRLTTFETWSKQILPNKFDLAKAGFYYIGNGDEVICFACSEKVFAKVNSWEKTDVPFDEHKKWSPNCMFLKMTGYEKSNQSVNPFQFPLTGNCNSITTGFEGFPSAQRHGNF